MNNKFIKNLQLFCRVRKENFTIWKRAYQNMPDEIKQNFQEDITRFADEERKKWN